jgi:hypothetical protein
MVQRRASRWIKRQTRPARSPLDEGLGITIRFAYPDDEVALRQLAALDSRTLPPGPLLLAVVAGELWAAVTLTGEPQAIADPFRHSAELVDLLHERAQRLTRRPEDRRRAQVPTSVPDTVCVRDGRMG